MDKNRSLDQNRSLHKLFSLVSDEARNKGVTVKMMANALPDADIPVNPTIIKDIWKIFQEKQLNKESTTELTTKEVDEVYEPFINFMAKNWDITQDFPSIEAIMNKLRDKDDRQY